MAASCSIKRKHCFPLRSPNHFRPPLCQTCSTGGCPSMTRIGRGITTLFPRSTNPCAVPIRRRRYTIWHGCWLRGRSLYMCCVALSALLARILASLIRKHWCSALRQRTPTIFWEAPKANSRSSKPASISQPPPNRTQPTKPIKQLGNPRATLDH